MNQTRWKDDAESKECFTCHKEFGMIRRRHHCRMCGYIFCSNCMLKYDVPKEKLLHGNKSDKAGPQLVCKVCIRNLTSPSSPLNTSRQTEDRTKAKKLVDSNASNLNNLSSVESLLALSNQLTLSQIDKAKSDYGGSSSTPPSNGAQTNGGVPPANKFVSSASIPLPSAIAGTATTTTTATTSTPPSPTSSAAPEIKIISPRAYASVSSSVSASAPEPPNGDVSAEVKPKKMMPGAMGLPGMGMQQMQGSALFNKKKAAPEANADNSEKTCEKNGEKNGDLVVSVPTVVNTPSVDANFEVVDEDVPLPMDPTESQIGRVSIW